MEVSPILILRARALAKEYVSLRTSVTETFNAQSARRMGELSTVANALKEWDESQKNITELSQLLDDPSTDPELRALAADDLDSTTANLPPLSRTLLQALIPPHPFANLPCLIEIRPGVGGSEAALFAGDLFRMYRALCSRRGLRLSVLKFESAHGSNDPNSKDVPVDEAIFEVETPGAYDLLRCEAGVHRVQRVPATEAKGRTHTSVCTVLVMPSLKEESAGELDATDPASDAYVDVKEVRLETMRARGAGGQHVNTTDSAVRLTHIPTGISVSMQDSRSQQANRTKAWQVLRSRLVQRRREEREEENTKLRQSILGTAAPGRSDKIRTYNWIQQRVTDHRTGITMYTLADIIAGGEGLDEVMESVKGWLVDQEVHAMIDDEKLGGKKR
ncbi:MAG: hypothetical protein M1814_005288 [Vezdaea aestivalis]|nr:MAG: hypothetical protein M1814_005288 [Vezdaea aestivalis]